MPGKTDLLGHFTLQLTPASMRPQRNAGENRGGRRAPRLEHPASMRPQRNAGENVDPQCRRRFIVGGFNEAPAKCRGKRLARCFARVV